jgi:hypothetical protein
MRNPLPKQSLFTTLSLPMTLAFIMLVACGPANEKIIETPQIATAPETAYPAPPPTIQPRLAYPDPAIEAAKPLLALNKPVQVGDQNVTGVGPPGLTVELTNITFMGELLGIGVIDQNGTFSIPVDPLPSGIRIGLSADVSPLGLTPEDFQLTEGTISVPQVGYFFDSVVPTSN